MPDAGLELSREEMRLRAVRALEELADGSFAERMRVEAAARIVVTLRRVAVLAAAGEFGGAAPAGPLAHEHRGLKLIRAVNARLKVPKDCAELALLTEGAPAWAEALRAQG